MYKAVIFDRDGTLNHTAPKEQGGYALSPEDIILMPTVAESMQRLAERGIHRFVYTQQKCVGKGLLTEEGLDAVNGQLNSLLPKDAQIEYFAYCPHHLPNACECAKPKPGMITGLLRQFKLKPEEAIAIGDTKRDKLSAEAAGVDFVYVQSDDTSKHSDYDESDRVFKTLEEALSSLGF
jgi:histidinol-phosphate phosphatase family protein